MQEVKRDKVINDSSKVELTRYCRSGERDVSVIVHRKFLAEMSFLTFQSFSTS